MPPISISVAYKNEFSRHFSSIFVPIKKMSKKFAYFPVDGQILGLFFLHIILGGLLPFTLFLGK
jgi:hypothetical protein